MRRLIVLVLAASGVAFSFAAAASQPLHIIRTQGPFKDVYPAGAVCDFAYGEEYTVDQNIKRFFDADGNLVLAIRNETIRVTHTNLDTGYALSEVDHGTTIVDWVTGFVETNGQFWHLVDQDGRLVLSGAGRFTEDAFTGDVLSETPNVHLTDFAQVICTALGGAPAP